MKSSISHLHPALSRVSLTLGLAVVLTAFRTEAQTDDFNAGNDDGWTHFDLSAAGLPPSVYTFPADRSGGHAYRIYSPAPPLTNAGPARAISYRRDIVYTDFEASVDLVSWDPTLHQTFGLLLRGTNVGVGKTTGYIVNYVHLRPGAQGGAFEINRITGEAPVTIAVAGVTLDPTHVYRIIATGSGDHLLARIYDLADLTLPVAATEATDTTYASGYFGLFNFSLITGVAVTNSTSTADVTFDNYSATGSVPPNEPPLALDDFNDATDNGWTHLDLSAAGLPGATYTFPPDGLGGFAYRINAPSPPVTNAGPARAFSYRADVSYKDFTAAVDLIAWDDHLDQAFGLLARGTNVGLGRTSGYVFNYNPHQSPGVAELQINRVTKEAAHTIARAELSPLDPTRRYRMVATGFGSYLVVRLYDLADLMKPIASADVVDGTYSGGVIGLFDYSRNADTGLPNATTSADATFDNFFALSSAPTNLPPALFHGAPQLIDSRALDANPIDDFTDHTYTTNGVAVGSFAECAITRLFARQIQSIKQPLSVSLAAAMTSLERGHSRPAVNQLAAFQNKVRAQIAPKDPAFAATLIHTAQVLIDSMQGQ